MLRDYPMMHMARDAGLLALHDAGMTLDHVGRTLAELERRAPHLAASPRASVEGSAKPRADRTW
jgi:hypothetical protein